MFDCRGRAPHPGGRQQAPRATRRACREARAALVDVAFNPAPMAAQPGFPGGLFARRRGGTTPVIPTLQRASQMLGRAAAADQLASMSAQMLSAQLSA
jgi:hypothetical protein